MAAARRTVKTAARTNRRADGIVHARRPKFVFSGLTKCAVCGGGFTIAYRGALRCNSYVKAGRSVCANDRSIPYAEVERRLLDAVEQRLLTQERCDEICRLYTKELNRLHAEYRAKQADAPRELAGVKRRAMEILNWMCQGFVNPDWKAEVVRLGERQLELEAIIAATPDEPPLPRLHPAFFTRKVEALAAALNAADAEQREPARQAVRDLIDRIEVPPGAELLQVVGNLDGILTTAADGSGAAAAGHVSCGGSQPTLSAALATSGVILDRRDLEHSLQGHDSLMRRVSTLHEPLLK